VRTRGDFVNILLSSFSTGEHVDSVSLFVTSTDVCLYFIFFKF